MSDQTKASHLTSQSKEIIYNVSKYFEKQIQDPDNIPDTAFVKKTSEATLVNERTVYRIRKQKDGNSWSVSSKPQSKPVSKKQVDEFDMCAIRNKIHEFYTVRRQLPTLKNLHHALKEDINFLGSRSHLRRVISQLGFKWKRTQSSRKVLIERYNIVDLRIEYLRKIEKFRRQGLNIVYMDETWIDTSYTAKYCWQSDNEAGIHEPISRGQRLIVVHAGGKSGFVDGALLIYKAASTSGDYHSEMNGDTFRKWFNEKLLDNLKEKSIIVMDNASYHSVQSERNPTSSTRKADLQEWLRKHNVPFDNTMLRPQLLALAKANKPSPKFVIDTIAKEKGHEILRLPPYHPDLNPIEMIWSQIKRMVASKNTTFRVNDVLELTNEAFNNITANDWENHCRHVENIEAEYRRRDIVIDHVVDNVVINLTDDSSSDSDSNTDSSNGDSSAESD